MEVSHLQQAKRSFCIWLGNEIAVEILHENDVNNSQIRCQNWQQQSLFREIQIQTMYSKEYYFSVFTILLAGWKDLHNISSKNFVKNSIKNRCLVFCQISTLQSTTAVELFKKPKYVRSSDFAHFWKAEMIPNQSYFIHFFLKWV